MFASFLSTSQLTITHSQTKSYLIGLVRYQGLILKFIDSSRRDFHDSLDLILVGDVALNRKYAEFFLSFAISLLL